MNLFDSRPVLLSSLLCLYLLTIHSPASAQPGDVNGDDSISLEDAALIKDHILAISELTGNPLLHADANQNGSIEVGDLIYVHNNLSPQLLTIYLPGNVPLTLVRIPPGSFEMGSPNTERSRNSDEGPTHTVTINYDFYMGRTEVTQRQVLALMGSWPSTVFYPGGPYTPWGVGDNYPAYCLSWDDIQYFLTRLNQHIVNTGQGPLTLRLPSEAEWEYACRSGTQTRFFFGDSLSVGDVCQDDGTRTQYLWYCGNAGTFGTSTYGTKQVATKLPNAFGLYDMSGNVWEWCQDWYHSSYMGAPTDGTAWESPAGTERVMRGGEWHFDASLCRSSYRGKLAPQYASYFALGFRVVVVSP